MTTELSATKGSLDLWPGELNKEAKQGCEISYYL
jgi:hypothetical protein